MHPVYTLLLTADMGQSPGKKLVLLHFGSSKFANFVHDKFNNTTIQFLARFDSNGSRVPRWPKSIAKAAASSISSPATLPRLSTNTNDDHG